MQNPATVLRDDDLIKVENLSKSFSILPSAEASQERIMRMIVQG